MTGDSPCPIAAEGIDPRARHGGARRRRGLRRASMPHPATPRVAVLLAALLAASLLRGQTVWVEQGPGPTTQGQAEGIVDNEVVGAVRSVAAHPSDPDILFIGAVNGGIWRTGNATATHPSWEPQLGLDRPLSIGAIEFDPTDATHLTLIAGSGGFSSFGVASDRVGVWRTTNGGTTWNLLDGGGVLAGVNISGVAARGATLLISANSANSFASRGVWRSIDTGGTWNQISGGGGTGLPAGSSFDLAGDPSNSARLYTNAGTSGIYRSDDSGGTWTKASDATVDAALVGSGNVRISVGTSDNVYVAIVTGGRLSGLFRLDEATSTWASLDLPTTNEAGGGPYGIHPGGQGNTHLSLAADPGDANIVYVGGDRQPAVNEAAPPLSFPNTIGANNFTGRLFRVDASQPAGTQFAPITHVNTSSNSAPHADSRDMAFDANGDLVETDDGGVYRRTTPLLNTGDWVSLNGDLEVTELHDVAWDSVSAIALGGAQDTGSPHQITSGSPRWLEIRQGDGGDVAVDDTGTPGSSVRYMSSQRLSNFCRRTYDPSNTLVSQVFPALALVGGGNPLGLSFVNPVVVNRVTPSRLIIAGSNSIYESSDQGDTISEVGAGVVANDASALAYGAAGNADVLYVGAGDNVRVRTAAAPAGIAVSAAYPGSGTGRTVTAIALDPGDPQSAFAADATHVYHTPDGGGTWTDVTGNLPTLTPGALRSMAYSTSNADGSVIVGGLNGAFIARGPAFDVWQAVGTGLPRAPVFDLDYDPADEVLAAGLVGRGLWTASLAERDPVDVELVLDLSGSMLSPACATGCDSRLQVLKDAVELFVQLWSVYAIPDDRMGVTYFRTHVDEFSPGSVPLFPVVANSAALIADVQSQTTVSGNLTAMGGGIQTAVNRLTDAARSRNVILFTDGMQNVNPMVDATTFEIADQPGRPASGVAATSPPTDLNTALGRKVSTIGIGATPPFIDLLSHIATETNGLFKSTTAPDEDLKEVLRRGAGRRPALLQPPAGGLPLRHRRNRRQRRPGLHHRRFVAQGGPEAELEARLVALRFHRRKGRRRARADRSGHRRTLLQDLHGGRSDLRSPRPPGDVRRTVAHAHPRQNGNALRGRRDRRGIAAGVRLLDRRDQPPGGCSAAVDGTREGRIAACDRRHRSGHGSCPPPGSRNPSRRAAHSSQPELVSVRARRHGRSAQV